MITLPKSKIHEKTSFIDANWTGRKNPVLFVTAIMYDHEDPVAWAAIANVDREAARSTSVVAKPKPTKKEYEPRDPVDWHHVLASPNKKIRINKAWMFKAQVERVINERRKTCGILQDEGMAGDKEQLP